MPYPAKLTPEQITRAAKEMVEQNGAEALSMRTLAEALGVRASSLYRHIEGRDTLLRTIGDQAALNLRDELQQAAQSSPPATALRQAADAYLTYARTHPHLYALLLAKESELTPDQPQASAGKQLWNTLLQLVGAVSGHPDDTDYAVALWTFLHGFASLEATGTFGPSGPKGGLEVGLNGIIEHMQQHQTKGG
ncbi:TetR/AcrR family transcriptional regulator [Deinococcus cavernae]|uniref:TetR/AcrR family transcriptional regulator n=1 Tax=Deinococcus cavernae TaxID=2320857 RepID=UPI001F1A1A73|nr:TetR/AcrR family transcriptional regulator [Deinococcus cavernae]